MATTSRVAKIKAKRKRDKRIESVKAKRSSNVPKQGMSEYDKLDKKIKDEDKRMLRGHVSMKDIQAQQRRRKKRAKLKSGTVIRKTDAKGAVQGYKRVHKTVRGRGQGITTDTKIKNPLRRRTAKYKGRKYKKEGFGTPLLRVRRIANVVDGTSIKNTYVEALGKKIYHKEKVTDKKRTSKNIKKKVKRYIKKHG